MGASFEDRVAHDNESVTGTSPGDTTTSDEAIQVLQTQGVAAWRKWIADHAGPDRAHVEKGRRLVTDGKAAVAAGGPGGIPADHLHPAVAQYLVKHGHARRATRGGTPHLVPAE